MKKYLLYAAAATALMSGCNESVKNSDIWCDSKFCADTEVCVNNACISILCYGNTCPTGQTCNPNTGACEGGQAATCITTGCPMGQTCNQTTGICESTQTTSCVSTGCPTGQTCNQTTGICESTQATSCVSTGCPTGQTCNQTTGICEGTQLTSCVSTGCPTGQTCNQTTGICEGAQVTSCVSTGCPTGQTCNQTTGICEGTQVTSCVSTGCPAGQTCNQTTGICEGTQVTSCVSTGCPAGQTCNQTTGICEGTQVTSCVSTGCPTDHTCNQSTGVCEENEPESCITAGCSTNQTCNQTTGLCEALQNESCVIWGCPDEQTCNQTTGICVDIKPETCLTTGCPTGQMCNQATGQCENIPTQSCIISGCPTNQACNQSTGICEDIAQSCVATGCPAGQVCNQSTGICENATQTCTATGCPAGQICNQSTGICENTTQTCVTTGCPTGQACNQTTGICENISSCITMGCPTNQVCNQTTGVCEDIPQSCLVTGCPAGQTCNPNTETCEQDQPESCTITGCPAGQTCNTSTGLCENDQPESCTVTGCPAGQTCNTSTGLCEEDVDPCKDQHCPTGQTCNPTTGECEGVSCINTGCDEGKVCNPDNGKCVSTTGTDCSGSKKCNDNYETCISGMCVNTACIDVTCEDYQVCSITGKCFAKDGFCDTKDDCDPNMVCSEEHLCSTTCEFENENNIIPNWSFEEWDGSNPVSWSLHNTYMYDALLSQATDASACQYAVRLVNVTNSNARLESDPIHMPWFDFKDNDKYTCSAYVSGTGNIKLGYRATDIDGKEGKETYPNSASQTLNEAAYHKVSFTLSVPNTVASVQILAAFQKTKDTGVIIDAFTCIREPSNCDEITCNPWEICTTANYGQCVARDGYCLNDNQCHDWEECSEQTHTCVGVDGKCASHLDCAPDLFGTLRKCDPATHECVNGDPCDDVTCDEWMQCNSTSGKCEIKEGRCITSSDCLAKDFPACYGTEHTCVPIDFTYTVENAAQCRVTGYDKSTKSCPLNIVPNGGFEEWDDFYFGNSSTAHNLPVSWYGTEFEVASTHYATEIDASLVHQYTSSSHSGTSALQIEFPGDRAKRFTSEGFNVPGGSYNCAFWVRGKGDVRIHSFSSRGDAKKTDFVSYDTTSWVRVPFVIKEASSDMRLIFYISNTDASKDHIQIDDVVCTKNM